MAKLIFQFVVGMPQNLKDMFDRLSRLEEATASLIVDTGGLDRDINDLRCRVDEFVGVESRVRH